MGFSASPPSALLASHNRREFRTDELVARAEIQLASSDTNALRRRCGNKFSVEAQKRSVHVIDVVMSGRLAVLLAFDWIHFACAHGP